MALEYRAKATDFGAWLDRNVGKIGYLIGTRGQLCTREMIDYRLQSVNFQMYWGTISKYASQWIGKPVADCMGIYEMFMSGGSFDNPLTSWKYDDVNTGTVYSRAIAEGLPNGTIDTLPRNVSVPIAVCYSGHVGFFHHGRVYQASGHAYGLEITELSSTAHNHIWTNWYYLPWLDYTIEENEGDNLLQLGNTGTAVTNYQVGLQTMGYGIEPNGVFDQNTDDITRNIQASIGIAVTGIVDAETYGTVIVEAISKANANATVQAVEANMLNVLLQEANGKIDGIKLARDILNNL